MSYIDSRLIVSALPFLQPKKQHHCFAAYIHTLLDARSENMACIPDASTTYVPRDSFPYNPPPDYRERFEFLIAVWNQVVWLNIVSMQEESAFIVRIRCR
jgi:hypothetical protein